MNMDQTGTDQSEKKKNDLANKSGRMAILEEDKAREARRWQRKRETIKRFAGTK
jgi:flagellar motility protein MotE (MotC chaperone)